MKHDLKLDWLSFSWVPRNLVLSGDLPDDCDVFSEFLKVFPELDSDNIRSCLYIMDKGHRFYNNFLMFGDSWGIRYDNNVLSNKGLNVEIHPAGLEFWFDLLNVPFGNTLELLGIIQSRGCKVSRIDLCYDDFECKFTPSWYNMKASAGCIVSGHRSYEYIGPCVGRGGTIYFPARTSRMRRKLLRIYDKYIESGKDPEKNCIRYELSLNHQVADDFVKKLILCGRISFADVFLGYMRVLDIRKYDDPSQSPVCNEWVNWVTSLEFSEELKVDRRPAKPQSIEDIKARFSAMFGPYVYHMKQLYGDSWVDMLEFWSRHMSDDQKWRIYLYRNYEKFSIWEDLSDSPFDNDPSGYQDDSPSS